MNQGTGNWSGERMALRPMEVAQMLGISKSKVYEMLARGELPSIHIGSAVRVPVKDFEAWLSMHTRTPR